MLDFDSMSEGQLKDLIKDLSTKGRETKSPDISALFAPVPQMGECDQCGSDLRQLSRVGLTIKYSGFEFCCDCCYEEWMDARYESRRT
jgi:hypothetical protein